MYPAVSFTVLAWLCLSPSCSSSSGGGGGGQSGGATGGSAGAVGGAGRGGAGAPGGATGATSGQAGATSSDAGAVDAPLATGGLSGSDGGLSADAPLARACKGDWDPNPPGGREAFSPRSLRSDVQVRRVVDVPGNVTRLVRNPATGKLYLLAQNGDLSTVDPAKADVKPAYTAAQIGVPGGWEALGLAFANDGTMYVNAHVTANQEPNRSRAFIYRGKPNATGYTFELFAQSDFYPRSNTPFDHEWSGMALSPDGKTLYVNSGSRTDHGEVQTAGGTAPNARETALTARIFKFPTDAPVPLTVPYVADVAANERMLDEKGWVFARGTRNSFDLELAPNGDLIAGDNGPDADYHEELNWLRPGRHYGFPWRLANEDNAMASPTYDPPSDKRLDPAYTAIQKGFWYKDPAFPPKPADLNAVEPIPNTGPEADEYRDAQGNLKWASKDGKPFATFSDHGSPLGITFDPGAGDLCGVFSGKAFILRIGAAAGLFEPGRDLLFLDLKKTGSADAEGYTASVRRLVIGFRAPIDAVLSGDKMYIVDRNDNGPGGLYEVAMPNGR